MDPLPLKLSEFFLSHLGHFSNKVHGVCKCPPSSLFIVCTSLGILESKTKKWKGWPQEEADSFCEKTLIPFQFLTEMLSGMQT